MLISRCSDHLISRDLVSGVVGLTGDFVFGVVILSCDVVFAKLVDSFRSRFGQIKTCISQGLPIKSVRDLDPHLETS